MGIKRIPNWQYPNIKPAIDDPESITGIKEWMRIHHIEHEEESTARIEDFENLVITTLTVTDWIVESSLTLNYLTANRLMSTNSSKVVTSVNDLTSWIAGTTDQIVSTTDGDGTITLSLPQDYDVAATPTLGGLTLVNAITEFSTDDTLSGDSDSAVPTEQAVKAYVDGVDHTIYSLVDGTRAFTGVVGGISPTAHPHLATKEYVDDAIGMIIDYQFNNTASDIDLESETTYNMEDVIYAGEEELSKSGITAASDQLLFVFATLSGEPGGLDLVHGTYSSHLHLEVTGSGARTVDVYWTLSFIDDDGTNETLLMTSETREEISGSETAYTIHAVLPADVELASDKRFLFKFFGNGNSGNNATMIFHVEGITGTHISIHAPSAIFNTIYVRRDGTTPLTGDWDVGNFALSDIATLGLGTATVPHGGVGWAKLAIDGTSSNAAGPHIQMTVSTDSYPTMQILNYRHDDISIRFDSYWDGANKSSDAGSNYAIFKVSNLFKIMYDSGVAQGSTLAWNTGLSLNTSGLVTIPGTMAAGTVTGANVTSGADPGHTHTGGAASDPIPHPFLFLGA